MSRPLVFEFGGTVTPMTDLFDARLIGSSGLVGLACFIEGILEVRFTDGGRPLFVRNFHLHHGTGTNRTP